MKRIQEMLRPLSPEMRRQGERMREWMEAHLYSVQLLQTAQSLSQLEPDPKLRLTKAQAKAALALIAPWRKKPVMAEGNARVLVEKLSRLLTPAQHRRIASSHTSPMPGSGRMWGLSVNDPEARVGELMSIERFNPLNPATFPTPALRREFTTQLDSLLVLLARRAR